MALSRVPVEFILQLLPLLSKQDTSRLSRTCKRLRSITLAHVYGTIEWRWDVRGVQHIPAVSPPIHLLLRSLMENPVVGGYVERVDFQGSKNNYGSGNPYTLWAPEALPKTADSELQAAIEWVRYFGLGKPDIWNAALGRRDIDSYASLVLAFLPNLCSLLLGADFVSNSTFLGCLFKEPLLRSSDRVTVSTFPRYTQLLEAHLGPVSESKVRRDISSRFRDLYSVLYLPSLEVLTMELGSEQRFHWPSPSQRPRLASLTSLKLPHCEATETALERILSTKPPLKELLYDYSCAEACSYHAPYFFNLSTLSRALYHVHATLESLELQIQYRAAMYECPAYSNGCFKGSLDSFHHFARLSHLQIPFIMLSDWCRNPDQNVRPLSSQLPLSIRQLCFNDDMTDWECYAWGPRTWLDRVRNLIDDHHVSQGETIPSLQGVELSLARSAVEWGKEDQAEFETICKGFRIQSTFQKIRACGS